MITWNDIIRFSEDKEVEILIKRNLKNDVKDTAIQLSKLEKGKRTFILDQIQGIQKSLLKLPFLTQTNNIIYPQHLAIEQSSSEITARFKAKLVSGDKFVDLTSGFGVDAFFISSNFNESILVDKNVELLKIVEHNFKSLGKKNTFFKSLTTEEFLKSNQTKVDLIYIDPSRRIANKKIFLVEDCQPNLIEILPQIKHQTKKTMIKFSPMMDISEVISKISSISDLYVISVDNECKEILVILQNEVSYNGEIQCVELGKKPFNFTLSLKQEKELPTTTSAMKKYAYLPNVTITKAGAFKSVGAQFHLDKISGNTHVYTSDSLSLDFPGKIYECLQVLPYNTEALKKANSERSFNIVKRNFAHDVKTIAKKLGIKESGSTFLLAYRNQDEKPELAICQQINV